MKYYGQCLDCGHGTKKKVERFVDGVAQKINGLWDITKDIKRLSKKK
jgi:hypothetical protein